MAFQSRGAWTSRPNRAVKVRFKQKHLTWHYPGFGTDSVKTAGWAHSRCLSQIDTWEKQHQARGSKNIEYNYFVCPHGYVIEGRGDRQNGANGTSHSNRRGQSVQVLIGDNEPLTAGHRQGMREAVALIEGRRKGATGTQYGHRHWVGTRCPGPYVMGEIPVRAGASVPAVPSGGASVPAPSKPATKPKPSSGIAVDGRWGRETSKALQRFLKSKGHAVGAIDGRMGPKSWRALQEYLRAPYKDGKISRQSYRHTELGNGIAPNGWEYTGRKSKGSQTVELLQKWAGADVDGTVGSGTVKALQRKLNAGG